MGKALGDEQYTRFRLPHVLEMFRLEAFAYSVSARLKPLTYLMHDTVAYQAASHRIILVGQNGYHYFSRYLNS